jgi:hypothetical protein
MGRVVGRLRRNLGGRKMGILKIMNATYGLELFELALRKETESMTEAERAVYAQLSEHPVTQKQIAESERWIGTHPWHEGYESDTTTRSVRQIVQDLRTKHKVPVLSDRRGYFFSNDEEQRKAFLERHVRSAIASMKTSIETYNSMKHIVGENAFFESMLELINREDNVQAEL